LLLKQRIYLFITIVSIAIIILIVRIAHIQLVATENFSADKRNLIEESVNQRSQSFLLDYGRGRFVDRNELPLTHDKYPVLILFPFLKEIEWPVKQVATILNVSEDDLLHELKNAKEPFAFGKGMPKKLTEEQMEEINSLKIPGVYVQFKHFAITDNVAQPLLGVTGQDERELARRYQEKLERGIIFKHTEIGKTGLQRAFDPFLLTEGEAKLLYHVDGKGGPLFGLDVKYLAPANPFYPVTVQSTIDKMIQVKAEQIIDQNNITNGGLVLLDASTSDLLALVSRPVNLSDPFHKGKNQMLSQQIPGSIFKIVVAAAAIEEQMIENNRRFDCDRNVRDNGTAKRLLGNLSFAESFAQSCNFTFGKLAVEMQQEDSDILETYAMKLGLTNQVSWNGRVFHFEDFSHFPKEEEEIGRIWVEESHKTDNNFIAQAAIGQQDVRVTPLAVANMIATIVRNGEKKEVRTVSKISYKNGTTLLQFQNKKMDEETINPYTAMKLKKLLTRVTSDKKGTAYVLNGLPYDVAGKSGTAQISTNQNNKHHNWFAGYFPSKEPKYVLVIVNLNHQNDRKVYQAYEQMVKFLHSIDETS
jgi:penicillin-binding protein 4B